MMAFDRLSKGEEGNQGSAGRRRAFSLSLSAQRRSVLFSKTLLYTIIHATSFRIYLRHGQ